MPHGVSQEELDTPYGQVALKFSTALLNKSFDEAHSLLGAASHSFSDKCCAY